jgi:hypothetical protein
MQWDSLCNALNDCYFNLYWNTRIITWKDVIIRILNVLLVNACNYIFLD